MTDASSSAAPVARSAAPGHIADLLARSGGPWPAGAVFGPEGLQIAGVGAATLAQRYGTPLVVIDEGEARARARAVAALFPRVFYAVKAFTSSAMMRLVLEEGLDLVCATGGEVEACLRTGAPASRIALHGSNKSHAELNLAVSAGLSWVIADGLDELRRLDRIARDNGAVQPVLLRVLPGIEVETHEAIATGHEASKFGTPVGEVVETLRQAATMAGVRFDGLHAHVGSQVLDVEPYRRTLALLLGLSARLRDEADLAVGVIDLGGGFGVTYTDERALLMPEVAIAIRAELEAGCRAHRLDPPVLAVEPGRSIIANAGITLYRVGAVKRAGDRTLVAVDGGMADNVRPMLYDARYTVAVANAPSDETSGTASRTIVGRHCESGDVLAEDVSLPTTLGPGDLLAFAATGAYTYSLASNYNRVGRPAVVAVRDGHVSPWLRREDAADLDRFEVAGHRPVPVPALPEGVVIRPARPRDARSYVGFWKAIVDEGRFVRSEMVSHPLRFYRARFRDAHTDEEAQVVAVHGDRVVGHVYIQRERHPVTRHVATLGIAVASDLRGKGIGSALLIEALDWAKSVRVEKIVLSVYPSNVGAIALYRKFGFIEEGRLARHSRKSYGYEDEILMAAWIGGDQGR
jgi:diaminopimelate decarboxylase